MSTVDVLSSIRAIALSSKARRADTSVLLVCEYCENTAANHRSSHTFLPPRLSLLRVLIIILYCLSVHCCLSPTTCTTMPRVSVGDVRCPVPTACKVTSTTPLLPQLSSLLQVEKASVAI